MQRQPLARCIVKNRAYRARYALFFQDNPSAVFHSFPFSELGIQDPFPDPQALGSYFQKLIFVNEFQSLLQRKNLRGVSVRASSAEEERVLVRCLVLQTFSSISSAFPF